MEPQLDQARHEEDCAHVRRRGVALNSHGDIFAAGFNVFGRVHRFSRQQA
jgi:hypothetical protein